MFSIWKRWQLFVFFRCFCSLWGKKQRWIPGCVLYRCTGQRTTSSWWSDSDEHLLRGTPWIGWNLPVSRFHTVSRWNNIRFGPCRWLIKSWGSGPYPPWCCSPFEACGPWNFWHQGKSLKISKYICICLIPPNMGNLMIPEMGGVNFTTLILLTGFFEVFCERPGKKTWNRRGVDRQPTFIEHERWKGHCW